VARNQVIQGQAIFHQETGTEQMTGRLALGKG
jgi:hypothetical protein